MSTTNEYKIAIIGQADTISGLRALGVEAFPATSADEVLAQLRDIKRQTAEGAGYAVVCVIESLVKDVDQAEYAKVVDGPLPAVVLLPGPDGSQGFAINRLRALAEKAVGSAII